jgi:hypothetical protein
MFSVCRRRRCRRATLVTCWGERGAGGTTMTIAGWEVALSSLSKGGVDGGVAVIVEPRWQRCWGEGS